MKKYPPHGTPFGMYFALVDDPDGNMVLLSYTLGEDRSVAGVTGAV